MQLTIEKVEPFLPTLKAAKKARVEAWLPVISIVLTSRYGAAITTTPDGGNEAFFVSTAADALARRATKPADTAYVDQQAIAGASVRYNSRAALAAWFYPEEIAQMDSMGGLGGIRTVRMAAPDAVRFGALSGGLPLPDEE